MSIAEVKSLPINEKFQIMEAIWEDMSKKLDDMSVSDSEKALLDKRLERLSSGEAKAFNWDDIKDSIGKR